MKKQILYPVSILLLAGCSNVTNIDYKTMNDGCIYSEVEKPRKHLVDYFGFRDHELYVNYSGLTCREILSNELKYHIHKKPYNSIDAVNELPSLKVDVDADVTQK